MNKQHSGNEAVFINKSITRILSMTVILCLFSLVFCSCSSSGDKLVGKWRTGDKVIEFTADGRFLSVGSTEEPGYYDVLSGGKVLIYTEDAREEGIKIKFHFKNSNLFLGKLKYAPVKE